MRRGELTTTTQDIADVFGRTHAAVLKKLTYLIDCLPSRFAIEHVMDISVHDAAGKRHPLYALTDSALGMIAGELRRSKNADGALIALLEAFRHAKDDREVCDAADLLRRLQARPCGYRLH
jgi:hypothetical protein